MGRKWIIETNLFIYLYYLNEEFFVLLMFYGKGDTKEGNERDLVRMQAISLIFDPATNQLWAYIPGLFYGDECWDHFLLTYKKF